jgi:hypothetical protein
MLRRTSPHLLWRDWDRVESCLLGCAWLEAGEIGERPPNAMDGSQDGHHRGRCHRRLSALALTSQPPRTKGGRTGPRPGRAGRAHDGR